MPYAPGVQSIGGQLIAEGIKGASAAMGRGMDAMYKRRDERHAANATADWMADAHPDIMTPERLDKFHSMSLGGQKAYLGQHAMELMEKWKTQSQDAQLEMQYARIAQQADQFAHQDATKRRQIDARLLARAGSGGGAAPVPFVPSVTNVGNVGQAVNYAPGKSQFTAYKPDELKNFEKWKQENEGIQKTEADFASGRVDPKAGPALWNLYLKSTEEQKLQEKIAKRDEYAASVPRGLLQGAQPNTDSSAPGGQAPRWQGNAEAAAILESYQRGKMEEEEARARLRALRGGG